MRKIAVIGSTNTDMVISGKRIPVPGETVSGGHFMMNPGVKVTDAASAAKATAVDCVAAGDTFNGVFAVALAEGQPVADAIAFAQKASAISVTRPGAQSSIPCRKEVLATKDAKSAKAL
jgi:sugar/nucleoside kinase (ribokinase family)